VPAKHTQAAIASGITGGVIPKVNAVRRALEGGDTSAHIIDGRAQHALLLEVLTDAGCGTMVSA
jgi:acetylglutamate kinase